jgi:hypothetical protein
MGMSDAEERAKRDPDKPAIDRSRKTPEQHKIFAQEMARGNSLRQSMIAAGYSEKQAGKGIKSVSKAMMRAMKNEGVKMADFGKSLDMDTLKHIAIGRLATNAIQGKDGGCLSAKQLGSHRDLNLWAAESQAGVIVISVPNHISENKSKLLESSESSD